MDKLFLTILNMSLTGAFVIAAVIFARLLLKKAPKIISYCLWLVAAFRLAVPYSVESVFSLIPFNAQTIPPDIAVQPVPRIDSGIPFVNNAVSGVLPVPSPEIISSVYPLQVLTFIGSWIWIIGVAVMFLYGIISYFILKRKMKNAVCSEANIYEAESIQSPFVLGVFKPKIFLPPGLFEKERNYIILHEQTHIKRRDHIVKLGAYFILCLHWFNPLAWAAFLLMGVDMEMSCDERVLKEMGGEIKKDYSLSLLKMATERRIIAVSPLAFGEGGVKERLKNVLNFKKPSRIIVFAAVALVAVLSVGFAMNRQSNGIFSDTPERTPLLHLNFTDAGAVQQNIQAAQLTNGWYVEYENGEGRGYQSDSPHPLQLRDYSEFTLNLSSGDGEVELLFGDNYPPNSISVQRWNAVYVGSEDYSLDIWDGGEAVAVSGNRFRIENDGNSYIYEVYAKWNEGDSWYAFRADSGGITRDMTLADVRAIAQEFGADLTLNDLREFTGTDGGSGIFVYNYFVDVGEYLLTVGSGSHNAPVFYAILNRLYFGFEEDFEIHQEDGIDIRHYDIEAYIASGTRVRVQPPPEIEPQPTTTPSPDEAIDALNVSMHIQDVTPGGLSFYFEHKSDT
ncbi:MAG: M56 family metallopeptidase, partial [Clostridiales bacterium]|nr:M56 family metallopeptidase [Clostridiales bacterium]